VVEEVLLHKRIHSANIAIQRDLFRREWFVVMRRSLGRKRVPATDRDRHGPSPVYEAA
jgi:hypothetical protein